ncbi:MAG: hypothetical protein NUW37_02230 [Planctomycetes bacterium]|nr:hypothetical protein [Planctomycetota bacterium]
MKLADMSADELKELIAEVVDEKLREYVDPDYGLEFREEFIKEVEESVKSKERIPLSEVKKKLGID